MTRQSTDPMPPAVVLGLHAAVFVSLAWWTWMKWPDPLVDFGRELYVPWQLASGKVLYRDIESLFGPLSPYVNALWFRLFGASLLTLVVVNLVILAAVVAGVHRLVRLSTDRFTAAAASLVTLTLFGFLQFGEVGNYNFVAPYSHEATHGLALGVGLLLALHAAMAGGRIPAASIAGLMFGSLLLTKPETSIAAAAAVCVAFVAKATLSAHAERWRLWIIGLVFAASATIPPLLFFGYFARYMDAGAALEAITRGWTAAFATPIATNLFYIKGMGLDRPAWNAMSMLLMFAAFVAYVAAMASVSTTRSDRTKSAAARRIGRLAIIGIATAAMWVGAARALPLIVLAATVIAGVSFARSRRDREAATRWMLLFVWCTFALGLLAKLGFNARVHHYGFYLALPATTVVVVILCWLVPRHLETFDAGGSALQFRRLATAALVAGLAPWLAAANLAYRTKTVSVGGGPNRFLAAREAGYWQGVAARDAVLSLESRRRTGDTLAVLPEGVMLNYLARLDSPLRVINLMPPELDAFGEDEILGALRAAPPRFVILVNRGASEYGYPAFGTDLRYGRRTYEWIRSRYRLIDQFGDDAPTRSGYGIELLERKTPPSAPESTAVLRTPDRQSAWDLGRDWREQPTQAP